VLFLHLLNRTNSSAEISKLVEFLLDFLQPLVPLAMGELRLGVLSGFTSILLVPFFKLRDFGTEKSNLFAKDFEVIHGIKDSMQKN
jgi:hypothetical protein